MLTLATRLLIINCMCESVVSVALCYARELTHVTVDRMGGYISALCVLAVLCAHQLLYRDVGSFMGRPFVSGFNGRMESVRVMPRHPIVNGIICACDKVYFYC